MSDTKMSLINLDGASDVVIKLLDMLQNAVGWVVAPHGARKDFDEERRKEEEAERLRKEQEYNRKREEELKRQYEIDKPFMETEEEEDLPDIEDTYYRD